jgi:hypothetical protein
MNRPALEAEKDRLISALRNYKTAHYALLNYWDDKVCMVAKYPFKESLEDIQVAEWVNNTIAHIEYLCTPGPVLDVRKQQLAAEWQVAHGKSCLASFGYEDCTIINPFYDEMLNNKVDPVRYYGEAYVESDFYNKQLDLTREQMISWLIDIEISRSRDAMEDIFRHGFRGYCYMNDAELREELYRIFDIKEDK